MRKTENHKRVSIFVRLSTRAVNFLDLKLETTFFKAFLSAQPSPIQKAHCVLVEKGTDPTITTNETSRIATKKKNEHNS